MGCCGNNNCCDNKSRRRGDRAIPDGVDPCCSVRGPRCLCLPYDDGLAIAAQALTIVAFFCSWVWWATFIISIVGMTMFQIMWCTRLRAPLLYGYVWVAILTALGQLAVAIYCFVALRKKTDCYAVELYSNDDYWRPDDDRWQWPNRDYCDEKLWGTTALVCFFLWASASICLFKFVKSGRHAKWEEQYSSGNVHETHNVQLVEQSESTEQMGTEADILESGKSEE